MGLKVFNIDEFRRLVGVWIKSDQNGIERCTHSTKLCSSRGRIKSDQNGIERLLYQYPYEPLLKIKSDQNGIERVCFRLA